MTRALCTLSTRSAAALLAVLVGVGANLIGAPPAQAGSNYVEGVCITGYNYADPAIGYLFASTSGKESYPDQCSIVEVTIRNYNCNGDELAYDHGVEYVSASAWLPSGSWSVPCSAHYGGYWVEAHWLHFDY